MAKRFRLLSEEEEQQDMASTLCMDRLNLANVLMFLSRSHGTVAGVTTVVAGGGGGCESPEGKVFECKTCSRKFATFQALGGHRASHKKPRAAGEAAPEKPRVHECAICGLEFAVGQALGGHMRRHRAAVGSASEKSAGVATEKRSETIDLNLPPLEMGDEEEVRRLPKLLGFTLTSPMVDCLY